MPPLKLGPCPTPQSGCRLVFVHRASKQDSQKDMHIVHQLLCALYHVLRTPTINHPLQRPKWSRAPSHDPRSINCFRPACSIHSMSQAALGLSSKMRPLHVMGDCSTLSPLPMTWFDC